MSSIAQANQIAKLEEKVAALEAVFLRPQFIVSGDISPDSLQDIRPGKIIEIPCKTCSCEDKFADILRDISKIKNDVQGLKMRMGKVKSE